MAKYVITGSIGHISRPIVIGLVAAQHEVVVITSQSARVAEIEKLGAQARVGNLHEATFLTQAFHGADVVYSMIPPIMQTTDWRASQFEIAKAFDTALRTNGIRYVVNLSSIGAHAPNGIGPVSGLYDFEQLLNAIPGLNVKHLRPAFFYNNFLAQIGMIKQAGIMGANYGSNKLSMVHPRDIATAALEELTQLQFSGSSVRYIVGDERTGPEIAAVLGKAIGREIPWVEFTDEQQWQGLAGVGLPETIVAGYTEMGAAIRTGLMQGDLVKHSITKSPTKLEDFAPEFAAAFNA